MPCAIATVTPRTLGRAIERSMRGAHVSCIVERWDGFFHGVEVTPATDDAWGAAVRWPAAWFDVQRNAIQPGRYRVNWKIRDADGRMTRPTEKIRVASEGHTHVALSRRAISAFNKVLRHYRAQR